MSRSLLPSSRGKEAIQSYFLPLLIAFYAFYFRAHGIAEHFQLFGDQILYWKEISVAFTDLPLRGTPRVDGGYSLGPILYWILWLSREVIGPFTDYLPHAGGIGVAFIYGLSAGFLYRALLSVMSFPFSSAAILFIISSPFEASFSGNTSWNPGVGTAFVNFAYAASIRYFKKPQTSPFLPFIFAWVAFQAHFPAVFSTISIFLFLLFREYRKSNFRAVFKFTFLAMVCILCLQIPYFVYWFKEGLPRTSGATSSILTILQEPAKFHTTAAYRYIVRGDALLLFENADFIVRHSSFVVIPWLLSLAVIARKPEWFFFSWLPLAVAIAGCAVYPIRPDLYHLVTMMAPFSFLMCLGIEALSGSIKIPIWILLIFILYRQPDRFRESPSDRLPEYGVLVRGAKTIVNSGKKFRRVDAPDASPKTNAAFIVECLGVKPSPDGEVATIANDGSVRWSR